MIRVNSLSDQRALAPADKGKLQALHEAAFPPEEQQYTMPHMLSQAGHADCVFRVARLGERLAGYIYLEFAPEERIVFLWYMAVEESLRNRGIGGAIIRDTLDLLRRDQPEFEYALFETHRPRPDHDPGEAALDLRRIEFCRRLGARRVLGVDYRIPAADDPAQSIAYEPMFFSLQGAQDAQRIRQAVLLMAEDNFTKTPDDPRWLALKASASSACIET